MSIWTKILGGDDVIIKSMDLIDEAFYTDNEKAEQKSKLLEAMHPFKLIQRLLAKRIVDLFSILFVLELILGLAGSKFPVLWEIVSVLNSLDPVQMLCYAFLAVVSLYFTGGVVNSFKTK